MPVRIRNAILNTMKSSLKGSRNRADKVILMLLERVHNRSGGMRDLSYFGGGNRDAS